jgi:hypothetical protein
MFQPPAGWTEMQTPTAAGEAMTKGKTTKGK